jgi:hypothetical protein
MKKKHSFRGIMLCLFLLTTIICSSQSRGEIAFTALNVDGDDDFSVVALTDLAANSIIYFTDYEWDETNTAFLESGNDGYLIWNIGSLPINAGTIVVFTDIDNAMNNVNYGASIGVLTSSNPIDNVGLLATGETLFAYKGTNENTPTTFITGIKNGSVGTELNGTGLGGTDLISGTDFLEFNPTNDPDGGFFSSSRSNKSSYSSYLSVLTDKSNWTRNTSNGELLLPFSQEAFTISSTTWNGSSDNWAIANNWSNGVPTIDSNVSIPNTSNNPEIKSGTLALAGNITIDADASLEVTQDLSTKGVTTINSSASNNGTLKVTGTYNGSLVYNRNISNAFNSWYLISAPVHNFSVVDFATQNSIQLGSGTETSQNIALAKFDNSQALASDRWSYYTVGDTDHDNSVTDTTEELNTGQGFSTSLSASGNITFEGTLQTADVTRAITLGASGVGTNFNLVGNPYPSYLNSSTFMTNNSNITTTIWVWNQSLPDYQTKNLASDFKIAPGQGFFIEANSGTNVLFEKTSLSHETINTFQKNTNPYIKLLIDSESTRRSTEIYYIDEATTSFDNGYDGKLFSGVSHPYAIYSHLISDSNGQHYAIQSLPNSNYESMVIPIGINADAGKEINFSAEVLNLPTAHKVYLEDRETDTFTRLDEANNTYTITLTETYNGIGRFYLHTAQNALNIKTNLTSEKISIYKTDNTTLRIVGLSQGKTTIKLFNMLGKQLLNSSFTTNGVQDISLLQLSTGIYIIQLESEKVLLNKKIILE